VTLDLAAFARRIPKAELHVHLEGTISPQTYARIAQRNGIEAGNVDELFACSDFASFLQAFLRVVRVLQKPADFAELATDYLQRSHEDSVRHVEFFLSPATQRKFVPELDFVAVVRAVEAACRSVKSRTGISSFIIFDIVRNLGEPDADRDIDLALECRQHGVIGIGLGGDERHFPARQYIAAFGRARDKGLRRTAHAGEAAGAESIYDAVILLEAERIGHGVAARGRQDLQRLLRSRGVAIDACPTSNRVTGVVAAGEPHPLREFLDAGVTVTLNSDDPSFFATTIGQEYANAASAGLGPHEIAAIARHGFTASFLDAADKRRLVAEVDRYFDGCGIKR
jgi:adenosine deaminase